MNNEGSKYMDLTAELIAKEQFQRVSKLFDQVVYKSYLQRLSEMEILPYQEADKMIRWYRITKIVYEKGIFFSDKMAMLYASLHKVCRTVVMALHKENYGAVELYLGTRDEQGANFVSGDILEAGLKGFLPGIALEIHAGNDLLEGYEKDLTVISCVSGVGSLPDDKKENFIQGIEHLINATGSIPSFTALFIADKLSNDHASRIQLAYENLYSEIAFLSQFQFSLNESDSKGVTETLTKGFNYSVSENLSQALSYGVSESSSKGTSVTNNSGWNVNASIILAGAGGNHGKSVGENQQETIGHSEQTTEQIGAGFQAGLHQDQAYAASVNRTQGRTLQMTFHNRHVKGCLDIIDRQIKRIQKSTPFGLWSVATYFLTNDNTTAHKLAGIYRGTIVGENSEVESVCINHWPRKSEKTETILRYLKNQCHPVFQWGGSVKSTAGVLVDSRELSIHLSLPQTSVRGLMVHEEQAFGREVRTLYPMNEENSIALGQVMHLGELYSETVRLGIRDLSKHTFVTGTTGSGKSNTLYWLLVELVRKGKKFLVIEPAKGEYKELFGHHEEIKDVTVYGTNPRITKLLQINPFVFPDDIDVYEHIDALLEIFCACWPMYAAMPQVLKHAMIEAYRACGWDLSRSINKQGIYPNIEDVLVSLKTYINSSDYSSDTKGDYKGSLETRLHSLCEGLVGRIFQGKPISDEDLFNQNVIIDLSRVKSSETKSLLMGLLVLKLNEFRASERKGLNQCLRHITILEEAHHLLKRTSTVQMSDTSNVTGMAVERIANSMAEMRTYGEGFIIADQSPALLDLATIRNTNTKIIMALPETEDRELAGKAVGLTELQISEISRLKTGEAIVYQNGWEEPVKTKINYYNPSKVTTWTYVPEYSEVEQAVFDMETIFDILYNCYTSIEPYYTTNDLMNLVLKTSLPGRRKNELSEFLDEKTMLSADDCAAAFVIILGTGLWAEVCHISDVVRLNEKLCGGLRQIEALRQNIHLDTFLNMYVRGCSLKATESFFDEWQIKTIKANII